MKTRKKELRKLILSRKAKYSAAILKELSEEILLSVEEHPVFQQAQIILLYYSMKDEVYTHSFIEKWSQSKQIILPVVVGEELELRVYTHKEELKTGAYGILEPTGILFTDYTSIDLAIIPGVGFDTEGRRLGRGKGYYDRLLPQLTAVKWGICFPFQVIEEIPTEEFDICMDKVITGKSESSI
ncbi:5-formyltetrahydrofolate cyclo-ligase [Bacteroides sp. 224]|uniref:5-formyltetrahydrofolate cyclo-ligase n=1 Tax=Bacteroides sp. 224 TaxID=2302936 RepID=UPI0013D28C7B|nr:5-formyltetrahydrofolate cyclo-ligase [Bacteroides sp. 224]NDV64993.1 5-formyltetrahydrofolate cyclo-ligase [Bacteroides sp. 224]